MKELTKGEMKKILGGMKEPVGCCDKGQLAHCYGTQTDCKDKAWGPCDSGTGCREYCVIAGDSQYWY